MDIASPSVLYISSDEESGFGDSRKGDYSHDGGFCDGEDHDWLSELLCEVDRKKDDDSDDVVLVSEVISKPKRSTQRSKPSLEIVVCNVRDADDDDDCVVLEGNPDQPKVVKNGRTADHDDGLIDDSNDLEIVGEKGEVACRDFPHPRHLCANFAFDSTPHEVHCGQCHCYVCDSIAPCAYWGTGVSSSDHCHASDKENYWRSERKSLKKCDHPVATLPGITDYFSRLSQATQVPAVLPLPPNSLPKNQCLRPVASRPCSMSTNVRMPNIINQGRNRLAGRVVSRYKHQPQYVPQQLQTTRDGNVPLMNNSRYPVDRGPQFVHPPVFKRPGYIEALPNSRHGYAKRYHGSQLSRETSLKRCPTLQTSALKHNHGLDNQPYLGRGATDSMNPRSDFPVPQSMNAESMNYVPSQPQMQSQPCSSFHGRHPTPCRPQMSSQSNVSDSFENLVPLQSGIPSQSDLGNFEDMVFPQPDKAFQPNSSIPLQAPVFKQPDSGSEFENKMHSTPVIPSRQNQSSQFHPHSIPTSFLIDDQCTFQQMGKSQIATAVLDTSLSHANGQNSPDISQLQCAVPADNFQHRSVTEHYNSQSIARADNHFPGGIAPPDNPYAIDESRYHFPGSTNPDSSNFPFDDWIFENPSFPVGLEVNPMSPGLNVFSPEHASIEACSFFD